MRTLVSAGLVLFAFQPATLAASKLKPEKIPEFRLRARVLNIGGQAPEGKKSSFGLAGVSGTAEGSQWSTEISDLNRATVDYLAEVFDLYLALQHANIPVEFIDEDDLSPQGLNDSCYLLGVRILSRYDNGHWTSGESPYVVSVRFTVEDIDAQGQHREGSEPKQEHGHQGAAPGGSS